MIPMETTDETHEKMRRFCDLVNIATLRPLTQDETDWLLDSWSEGQGALLAVHSYLAKCEAEEALERVK